MFHAHPLDWEVVESHTVAPVQVLFKDDGSYPPELIGRLSSDARLQK